MMANFIVSQEAPCIALDFIYLFILILYLRIRLHILATQSSISGFTHQGTPTQSLFIT